MLVCMVLCICETVIRVSLNVVLDICVLCVRCVFFLNIFLLVSVIVCVCVCEFLCLSTPLCDLSLSP